MSKTLAFQCVTYAQQP